MWDRFAGDRPEEAIVGSLPAARLGTPEEVASGVMWLASAGAAYMVGQVIAIDGGYTCM
jgi:NAD(P)-dependent dehydrogenase (short-subunit alcohol dehydrogenase family)